MSEQEKNIGNSRVIKFRAWDKKKKEWRYSPDLQDHENAISFFQILEDDWNIWSGEDARLFQFTGLHDKNGKEIYEGDIVKLDSWEDTQQIKFIEGAFCLAFLGGKYDGEYAGDIHYIHHAGIPQASVIGNIYENPELLQTIEE